MQQWYLFNSVAFYHIWQYYFGSLVINLVEYFIPFFPKLIQVHEAPFVFFDLDETGIVAIFNILFRCVDRCVPFNMNIFVYLSH